jgi:outer membrane receptor for ferrienterochelin and colicin
LFGVHLFLSVQDCFAQPTSEALKISGIVTDSSTHQPLKGATVMETISKKVILSDDHGFYEFFLSKGNHELTCSFLGYKNISKNINILSDQTIDFRLTSQSVQVKEVTITSRNPARQVQNIQTGTIELSRKEIANLPLFLGESDFYKALQLMPGVQVSGEGNAAIYVRGGGYDQNLILLDQATVYNPAHLLGFYSVFNTDIVNEVTLIKSGMPAEFGNRISSVLEFSSKRTIPKQVSTTGNIGLISSKANVDIPLFDKHGALFLAARKTYLNSLLDVFRNAGLIKSSSILYKTGYDFYDLNGSLVLAPTKKDRIFLSTYKGDDWFVLNSNVIDLHANMDWGNQIASLSWNHFFHSNLYIDNYLTYSGYGLNMTLKMSQYNLDLQSGINDYGYKNRVTWVLNKHKLRTGLALIRHNIRPNSSSVASDSLTLNLGTTNLYKSYELSYYLSDEVNLTEKLGISAGLRFNSFYHVGPFTDYLLNSQGDISDTIHYRNGQVIKNYNAPEVRLSARYLLSSGMSLKLSFNTNNQYVHLVNVSNITFPTDFWIPSSRLIKPQTGNQWTVGVYKNFLNLETSVEVYYKTFRNQIEFYKGIFNAANNTPLDENLIFGKGRAYGAELLVRKTIGKFTGWFGYTFSRTEKSFPAIEDGRWFPARYDRPHDVSVVVNYVFNQRWTFSAVFVFASGNTYTPIVGRYIVTNNVVNQYGSYNSARMPAYHRLDLSATCLLKKTDKFTSTLNFSVLNAYDRHNPFFIYPEATGDISKYTMKVEPKEVSIFPILPSVSWQFSF